MSNLPKAVYEGELKMGNITLKVCVLDDGRRVIDQESLENFFKYLSDPDSEPASDEELANLGKFIHNVK